MQPPLPQAQPPQMSRSNVYGRGMSIGAPQQQPLLRFPAGRWLQTGELIRTQQRGTPEQLMACQELFQRQNEGFQRQNEGPQKTFEHSQHWGPKIGARVPQLALAADVGAYTGGGGGAGRNIGYINAPYSSVATQPNSGQQLQQSQQNQQQLRPQPPPLPPSHNPHNSGVGTQSLPPHSQHHPHPHSALQQSHQVITTGGAVSGLGASVQQVNSGVGPPGSNPAQQVQQHDLNAQGIPQGSSQQIQVPGGVVIPTGANHPIMYTSNQNAQQQGHQQPNHQVRRLVGGQAQQQYYTHQTGAPQLQGGQRHVITPQHMQVTAGNYSFVPANMMPQMHPSNVTPLYQHYTSIPQARPGATTQYQQIANPGHQYHTMSSQYHQMQAPIFYQPQQQMAKSAVHVAPPVQREKKIIPIINPDTQENILDNLPASNSKHSQLDSPIQSRDSSGVNTPALRTSLANTANIKAQFALQVTQVATDLDENKESVNDSGLSTIDSEVASHSMDSINSDVRENFSSVSNNSVDNSSKDTDVNKIARNVPDHNVSKPHQSQVSSFQQTLPLPSTVATNQQSQPNSQPQRQNKQARIGNSTAVTSSSQSQTVASSQPQSVKGSGPQSQPKQTSQNMQSKSSNQPQQKGSGNQVPSGKGSPANALQPKSHGSQSQGAQKLAQQQPQAIKQPQQQHHSKMVPNDQQLPKMMQGDQPPLKLTNVEQPQVKGTPSEHAKVVTAEQILSKDSELQPQSCATTDQPLGKVELEQTKTYVDHFHPNISAAKPSQQKASPESMQSNLAAEHHPKSSSEHNVVKAEQQLKCLNDQQQSKGRVESQFPKTCNKHSSLVSQSFEMRSNVDGVMPSSITTSASIVENLETSTIPLIKVNNKSTPSEKSSSLEQVAPVQGFTPMNGTQPSVEQPQVKGTPSELSKVVTAEQILPKDSELQQQSASSDQPLVKVEFDQTKVYDDHVNQNISAAEPQSLKSYAKPQQLKASPESMQPNLAAEHQPKSSSEYNEVKAEQQLKGLNDQQQQLKGRVESQFPKTSNQSYEMRSDVDGVVPSSNLSSTCIVENMETSHIPVIPVNYKSTPTEKSSSVEQVAPVKGVTPMNGPQSQNATQISSMKAHCDQPTQQVGVAVKVAETRKPLPLDHQPIQHNPEQKDISTKKSSSPVNVGRNDLSGDVSQPVGNCIDETPLEMKNVNESGACEKVAFDMVPKYWYSSIGKPLPNSPPSAAKAEELLKALKIIPSDDNSLNEDNNLQVKKGEDNDINQVKKGDCYVNESGKKVSQHSKKIIFTESASTQNAIPDAMAAPSIESGKKQYDRDFLIGLQQNPLSLMRPISLPDLEVVLDLPHQKGYEYKQPKLMQDFIPSFMQSSNRNRNNNNFMQQKVIGRNSQQGRRPQQKIIDIKLSSSSEVKLKTSENAWKPSTKDNKLKDETGGSNSKHEELLKRTRGILNKLTPDNFVRLSVKVKELPIETYFDLDGIIVLVFEKAVDEQAFSSTYAQLCQVLSTMTVKHEEGNKDPKEGKETRFRNLMINRCQKEFEKDNSKNLKIVEMGKQLEECSNADEKQELKLLIDYEESRLRKRSVGNIRFIGELYKLKMLTSPIMMRIIEGLLKKRDEESLECLCKLLTTIGKNLEASARLSHNALEDFNKRFHEMQNIIEDKKSATSSRVRFLLMDVVDLRKSNWVPRREDSKPKTKAEVHADIKKEEELQQQQLHMMANNTPRRDDSQRKNNRNNRDRDNKEYRDRDRDRGQNDDGWNMVGSAANSRRTPLDTSRLTKTFNRQQQPTSDTPEFRTTFNNWSQGSSGGSRGVSVKEQPIEDTSGTTVNRFAALAAAQQQDDAMHPNTYDKRAPSSFNNMPRLAPGGGSSYPRHTNFGSKSMPGPSEKENALSEVKRFVHPGDRSKSNSRSSSRDNSISRNVIPALPEVIKDPDVATKYAKAIIDEYMNAKDLKDARICVTEKFPPCNMNMFISEALNWAIDRSVEKRNLIGKLFHELIKFRIATLEHFKIGAKEILEMVDDFRLDIPAVDRNLGEMFACLLVDGVVNVGDIYTVIQSAEDSTASIMAEVVLAASKLLGETKIQELWSLSDLRWENLIPKEKDDEKSTESSPEEKAQKRKELITTFLKRHKLEFTATESLTVKLILFEPPRIKKELLNIFKRNSSSDEIFGWIEANVGENSSDPLFVRALTQALIESLMTTSPDGSTLIIGDAFEGNLKEKANILKKCVGNKEDLEMKVILGIQQLSAENQHPPGFTEKCFNALYDAEVLSDESFAEWEKNDDPEEQLGKGVCLSSVRNFLKWLQDTEVEGGEAKQISLPK